MRACNFRPIIQHCASSKSPILFRSNTLDDGSVESAQWIRDTMGIKSYVDLRVEAEFCAASKLDNFFIRRQPHEISPTQLLKDNNARSCRYRYSLGFTTHNFDWKTMSLLDYYLNLLTDGREKFHKIFLLMTDIKSFPMLIACRYGKDRTGVVAALIMDLIGCTEEQIIKEYSKSEELLKPLEKQLREEVALFKISEEFFHSPPELMKRMLYYLKENYGSAEGYLKICGLKDEEIQQIKINLSI